MSKRGELPHAISVRGKVYARLEREAERRGVAVSSLVEEMIRDHLGGPVVVMRPFRKRVRR